MIFALLRAPRGGTRCTRWTIRTQSTASTQERRGTEHHIRRGQRSVRPCSPRPAGPRAARGASRRVSRCLATTKSWKRNLFLLPLSARQLRGVCLEGAYPSTSLPSRRLSGVVSSWASNLSLKSLQYHHHHHHHLLLLLHHLLLLLLKKVKAMVDPMKRSCFCPVKMGRYTTPSPRNSVVGSRWTSTRTDP